MISEIMIKRYCCEDISRIENYAEAVNSPEKWECHHRLELIVTGGVCDVERQDLIDWNIYYNRPASELIFLTHSEHLRLHRKDQKFSEEHKRKLSDAHKGQKFSEEHKRKIAEAQKGRIVSEETRKKIAESKKGKPYNWKVKHWKLVDGHRFWY